MLERLTITDQKAAAAFANARTRAIVFELMRSGQTLSNLRDTLGISLSLLHYHLTRLQLWGLVVVSFSPVRKGRARKIYRAAASEFLVPGAIANATGRRELRTELEDALERAGFRDASNVKYFLDEHGIPRMRRTPGTEGSKVHERWWRLRLSGRAAAQLSREIAEVIARYQETKDSAGARHLCHFAVVQNQP